MKINNCNQRFVEDLFAGLNAKAIHYAVGGDYEGLPDKVGHDIDIWTDDVKSFRGVLLEVIKKNGHHILIDNTTANGCNVAFYKREGETLTFMKIDVMVETSYKSVLPLVNKEITAKNIVPYKNFYILNSEIEALGHFLYPMFEWGFIKKDVYKSDIQKNYKNPVFREAFLSLWGKKKTGDVLSMIGEGRWDEIEKRMKVLRKQALLKGGMKARTWSNLSRTLYYVMYRYLKPSGKCLAFCGLDGAGKTTILDELNDIFVSLLKKKKVYYGYWRPFVIPEIRELFGKKNSKDGIDQTAQKGKTIVEPERKPKNKLVSLVKLLYYWIDYMLAPFKYGGVRSRGGVVLFDRHYVDMAVHPHRFEMGISRRLILFLYKFILKADFTFFLYCTPEEILKRKQEFTADEIKEQTEKYLEVGKSIRNFVPIHTNSTIAEEIDEILSHVAKNNS